MIPFTKKLMIISAVLFTASPSYAMVPSATGKEAVASLQESLPVRTLPPKSPDSDYTDVQRLNWYLGQLAAFSRACGYFGIAQELTSFKTDEDAFSDGLHSLSGADRVSGCPTVKSISEELLEALSDARG